MLRFNTPHASVLREQLMCGATMDPVGEAALALAELFPVSTVVVEASAPNGSIDDLRPEERACVASAVAKRRGEFAAGRACARRALAQLGLTVGPLLPGPHREPRWPAGCVGSITHTTGLCAVAVAYAATLASIGIDAESVAPLGANIEPLVCTETERAWLARQAPGARGRWAKLLFSAKEAFYKCQYPRSRTMLDFRDVELALDADAATFSVRLAAEAPDMSFDVQAAIGRWTWTDRFVLTASYLPGHVAAPP